MAVRKFRSAEEMEGARPLPPLDPDNLRVACELSELAYALKPWRFIPGVYRFRSVEEASWHRTEWLKRQVRRGSANDVHR